MERQISQRSIAGYLIGRTIGRGLSGKVKHGIHPSTNEQVALKIIHIDQTSNRQLAQIEREIAVMQSLDHPNILQLLSVEKNAAYPKRNGSFKQVMLLVLELAPSGELFEFLMHTGALSEKQARTHFSSLLSALECCHANGICHRDLKPENLLLNAEYQLKVADFGLAALVTTDSDNSDAEVLLRTQCGTYSYMAPEIFANCPRYQGTKVDIWSAGVVVFVMLIGHPPLEVARQNDWWFRAIQRNRYDQFWAAHLKDIEISQEFKEFVNSILVVDPAHRATLQDIREHPWMQGEMLSPQELKQQFSERRAQLSETERLRREQAEAEAADNQARQTQIPFPMSADAFSCNTSRHITPDDDSCSMGPCSPPSLPEYLQEAGVLYSSQNPEGLFGDILNQLACAEMKARVLKSKKSTDEFKIKASFEPSTESGLSQIEVDLRVYSVFIQGNQLSALHLQRRAGDLFEYQKIYKTFRDKLCSSEVEGPDQQRSSIDLLDLPNEQA